MVKFISIIILVIAIIIVAGIYPHVAVGVTAVTIVTIFKAAEWFNS